MSISMDFFQIGNSESSLPKQISIFFKAWYPNCLYIRVLCVPYNQIKQTFLENCYRIDNEKYFGLSQFSLGKICP